MNWEAIRDEHGAAIWAIIFRIIRHEENARDCFQEVLLEAYMKSQKDEVRNLPGYLRWLAVRRAFDHKRKVRKQVELEPLNDTPTQGICVSSPVEFAELVECIRMELENVPSNQAEAFWLCCVEEMSYREASEAMGISSRHLGVLLHRARVHLRSTLAERYGRIGLPTTQPQIEKLEFKPWL